MTQPLKVGVSVCFEAPDPQRKVFTGKPLQYVEQSLVRWVAGSGALPVLLPSLSDERFAELAELCDGLVLHGGADVSPTSYGQVPLRPEWNGDGARDRYEIGLLNAFLALDKPVLGICRGMQLLNVAMGGTLLQDIATQRGGAVEHRNAASYDQNFHEVEVQRGSWLHAASSGEPRIRVNSIHHQAVDRLASGLTSLAQCTDDGIVEAIEVRGAAFVTGVQWHPEFHAAAAGEVASGAALLSRFGQVMRRRNGMSTSK